MKKERQTKEARLKMESISFKLKKIFVLTRTLQQNQHHRVFHLPETEKLSRLIKNTTECETLVVKEQKSNQSQSYHIYNTLIG